MKKDINSVEELMKILNETGLTNITFEEKGFKVKIKKSNVPAPVAVQPVVTEEKVENKVNYEEIKSTHIGNFFFIGKDGNPMVSVGDEIKEGQELGYVTTIGVKSPVKSTVSGIVREILVENGSIADYGKTLMKVEL